MRYILLLFTTILFASSIKTYHYSKSKNYCDNNKWRYCSSYDINYTKFKNKKLNQIVNNLYTSNINEFYDANPQNDIKEVLEYKPERDLNMFFYNKLTLFTITKETLTIKQQITSYHGGAHGSDEIYFYNYGLKSHKLIKLQDIYNIKKLTKIAQNYYKKTHKIKNLVDDGWFENRFILAKEFAIMKKGILFYYNSYEIKPYSYGHTKFFIPYSILTPALR